MIAKHILCAFLGGLILTADAAGAQENVIVNATNFARAETDSYMALYSAQGAFGKLLHIREPVPIEEQDVIRMNRDTLYSAGVFDLTEPVTLTTPDSDRFQSMLAINQDHYVVSVAHDAGVYTLTEDSVGSRYVFVIFRTFMDPNDAEDIVKANALQDAIVTSQANPGALELPDWDRDSLLQTRGLLNALAAGLSGEVVGSFGSKDQVDPILHLITTGSGWGGNPPEAAVYGNGIPTQNDGAKPYRLSVADVPVDGFWSLTVYNEDGYMQANDLNAYSVNNVTAERDADDGITIHFGDCDDGRVNCLPITKGWNYVFRLYQPRAEILNGSWTFPDAQPM